MCELHALGATTPRVLAQWPGFPRGDGQELTLLGDTLFARMSPGIALLDVSNPAKLRRAGTMGGDFSRVTPATSPYLFEYYAGPLRLLDVSDRGGPVEVSRVEGNFGNLAVAWPYVYTSDGAVEKLRILDYSDPAHPIITHGTDLNGYWQSFAIWENCLVGIDAKNIFSAFDIVDRTNLVLRGSYPNVYQLSHFEIAGHLAYVGTPDRLIVLDLTDSVKKVGEWAAPFSNPIMDVVAFQDTVWVSLSNFGMQILDVTDPAHLITAGSFSGLAPNSHARRGNDIFIEDFLTISTYDATNPRSPQSKGVFDLGVNYYTIGVTNNIGYLLGNREASHVLDLQNPARPVSVGTLPPAYSQSISGDKLFLIDTNYQIQVFDISNPSQPVPWSKFSVQNLGYPIVAEGLRAFVTAGPAVKVINFSNPAAPFEESQVMVNAGPYAPSRMIRSGTNLLACSRYNDGYLSIVNISDPAKPALTSTATATNSPFSDLAAAGNAVYLRSDSKIEIWDISDPANPTSRGTIPLFAGGISVAGNRLLVIELEGLEMYDISQPFNPSLLGKIDAMPINMASVTGIGDLAYIAGGTSGLIVVQLSGDAPPIPGLDIFNEGEMHRIRWPADYDGYTLQSAPSIGGPWSSETPGYSPFKAFNEATFSNRSGQFYRLQK